MCIRDSRWPGLFLSPVDKVRREYAIYLDHCQRHGVTILRGDTSLDLTGRAFGMDFAAEAAAHGQACVRTPEKCSKRDTFRWGKTLHKAEISCFCRPKSRFFLLS
mgnify:CR=1 FL=1